MSRFPTVVILLLTISYTMKNALQFVIVFECEAKKLPFIVYILMVMYVIWIYVYVPIYIYKWIYFITN